MSTKENSTSKFLHSIEKYSKRRRLKIAEEIKQIEDKRLKSEERKIIQNAKNMMMSELDTVRSAIFVKISNAKIVSSQRISQKKQEIENAIFDICESKIKKFTKSDKYTKRLVDSIDVALKVLGLSIRIFAREQDIEYLKQDPKLDKYEINKSGNIKYGGLLFVSHGMILDDTFDTRISEQKSQFSERYL